MSRDPKPPKLFSFAPDVELQSLRGGGLSGQAEPALRSVLLSFAAIATAKRLTLEVLRPIVDGCENEFEFVRGVAINRLVVLSHYFPEAAEALSTVCLAGPLEVRIQAIPNLVLAPRKLTTKIVRRSIADENVEVRRRALQIAKGIGSRRLERLLIQRLEHEEEPVLNRLIRSILESTAVV